MTRSASTTKHQAGSPKAASTAPTSVLVVIDSRITDAATSELLPGAIAVQLDAQQDGVEQITHALQQHPEVTSLHIMAHGTPGTLFLGNTQLSLKTLEQYSWDLQSWSASSILFYGCSIAVGDAGAEFVEKLHMLTGATIADSQSV
ncbi:DUF4347 domain-containing protein [Oscillatoria sp. FACHB-1407]|uniref:DUF4347 domain-containing protein n=1 Tax=Oscillatoria sp. FACHB-1407 TaxID=2692847 RepID=UPI001681ED0F|nr:DUF4347 domain-containing protein [Oscillatoria sp. FACHB-1407]MBD2461531.1 DUF4347 domain-containing protein [Oscillatoria sp. FACHB-1407]